MNEIYKILKGFFENNKSLVFSSIGFQILYSILETILIPLVLAGAFNNITSPPKLKKQLLILVGLWIIIKTIGCISLHYHNQIEPEITKYIVMTIMNSVFKKYENENLITNVSKLIDRIHLIKTNLHDFSYLLFTVFIPKIIVLLISCTNILFINLELGLTIIVCIIIQYVFILSGSTKCVNMTCEEHKIKDNMYEHIEDIFSNMRTIQCTNNGYDYEMNNLLNITENVKEKENKTYKCINMKQFMSYGSNIFIFGFIIFTIFRLYIKKSLTQEQTTTTILLVIGLFDNMSDMSYYLPELSHRYGILKSNEDFLRELVLYSTENKENINNINSFLIEFRNVTFKYPKTSKTILQNFNITIPEKKIITIFGQSGVGKTTFTKILYGIEKPTEGDVYIDNKNINEYNITDIRKHIAYIEQNTNNLFNRSIFDNIIYGIKCDYEEKNKIKSKLKDTFTRFNLYNIFKNLDKDKPEWSFLDQNVGKLGEKLSGGQKKLIHLLRLSLNENPKIIILDEPTNGLDTNTRNNIISFVDYLKSKGNTIILISHDEYLKNISDHILEFYIDRNPVLIK